jgi:hypothetical protein
MHKTLKKGKIDRCDYVGIINVYVFDNFCDLGPYDDVNNLLQNPCLATADSCGDRVRHGKHIWTQKNYKVFVSVLCLFSL